ncbi:MAG: type III-A CRISPR-associated RAMP protein Csm5 [Desulfovibrio sp.]|nr:type III-A CRISPR-associated RAMP protein Csm5 [Desulfovibrio sp.]
MSQPIICALQGTLEILTPVHVGSGAVYSNGLEFFIRGQQNARRELQVLQRNWITTIEATLRNDADINALTQSIAGGNVTRWLNDHRLLQPQQDGRGLLKHTLSLGNNEQAPREIREQIRSGLGLPLLPGSSIKGALRTAIVAQLLQGDAGLRETFANLLQQRNLSAEHADSTLLQHVLGEDPKYNLMRTLRVGDAACQEQALTLYKVRTLSLGQDHGFTPKPFLNVVEGLKPGTTVTSQLSLDCALQRYAAGQARECFRFRTQLDAASLLGSLRTLSQRLLREELAFLDGKRGEHIDSLRTSLKELQERSDGLGEGQALFNLGWGIGWKGMTGALLSQDALSRNRGQLRQTLKLAATRVQFPFPKSRKVAIVDGAALPMGWIQLTVRPMDDQGRARLDAASPVADAIATAVQPVQQRVVPSLAVNTEVWSNKTIVYTPNTGKLGVQGVTVQPAALDLLSPDRQAQIKASKKKTLAGATVKVQKEGNAITILGIEFPEPA